mmetsp:Transcript_29894/g.34558  ORF Transcript_29894/g.34558 Transcript_29894/m.34558 type:complete len:252 (+) Transcript_29894:147-902(+)
MAPRSPNAESVARTIRVTSVALWIPHVLVLLYIAAHLQDTHAMLMTSLYALVAIPVTYVVAVKFERGDCLMVLAWFIGLMSETRLFGFGPEILTDVPRWVWIAVATMHGVVGGILTKAKDMEEGRYFPGHTIAERLYVVVPFTIGQWCGFVLVNGWAGIVTVFSTIFLCLSTVGYGVVTWKLLVYFNLSGDIIGLVSRLFTTSFGVVFGSLMACSSFVIYLAIPFLSSLMRMNALVSSMGIVFEILLYEVA